MNTSAKRLRFGARFKLVCFFSGACTSAGAANADPFPFYSAAGSTTETAPSAPTLELRGIIGVPGKMMFAINEPSTRFSAWVALDEPGYAWTVKSHDPRSDSIIVEYGGRRLALALVAPGNSSKTTLNRNRESNRFLARSPDEASRLEALANEVTQMRLVREDARQSGNDPR